MVPFVPTLVSTYGCGALALSLTLLSHMFFFVLGHKNTQHPSYHMKAPHDSHCMYMYVYVFLGISLYTYHMHKLFSFDTDSVFVRFAGWDGRRLPVAAAWILLIQ